VACVFELDAEEQRVLGTLIEKQLATPQYYPLTLSALVQGCNQSTSRDPVTDYSEAEVREVIARLKEKQLIRTVLPSHGRSVDRYGHRLDEQMPLIKEEIALLGVLMLRGAQTVNELRTRTERLAAWEPPDTAESILERLASKPEPLAQNIGRGPGRREDRWVPLLGPVDLELVPRSETKSAGSRDELGALEARVAALEADIADLKQQLGL
jgi:uncharacterized protein YceH (UPF0502 family)